MGAGIIGAVSRHMVRQAATCLEARLAPTEANGDETRGSRPSVVEEEAPVERADLTLTAGPNDVSSGVRAATGSPILPLRPGLPGALPRDRGAGGRDLRDDEPRDHPHAG